MKKIIIKPRKVTISPKRKLDPYQRGYLAAQRNNSQDEENNCGCLCMFLGGFGPLGLIVAAIIGKANGVKSALIGWVLSWLILIVLYFIFVGIMFASR